MINLNVKKITIFLLLIFLVSVNIFSLDRLADVFVQDSYGGIHYMTFNSQNIQTDSLRLFNNGIEYHINKSEYLLIAKTNEEVNLDPETKKAFENPNVKIITASVPGGRGYFVILYYFFQGKYYMNIAECTKIN